MPIARVGAFGLEDVMREIIRDVLLDAATGGWSVGDAADEVVYKTERLAPHTANAIARTDLNGLSNGGSLKAAQQALAKHPEPVYKTWLSTPDERTRESHIEADGQTVALNENFQVGGFPMPYPGYPLAPAEEVINCRCTITYTSDPTGQAKVVTDPRQPPQPEPEPPAEPLANVMPSDEQVDAVSNSWYQDISGRVYGKTPEQYAAELEEKMTRELSAAEVDIVVRVPGDVAEVGRQRGRLPVAVRVAAEPGHVRPEIRAWPRPTCSATPRTSTPRSGRSTGTCGASRASRAGRVYGNTVWSSRRRAGPHHLTATTRSG